MGTITPTQKICNALFAYMCSVKCLIFYALCDNLEFKYAFKLSVDICALSHNSLWWPKLIKQTVGTIHSHICIQNLIICAECQHQIRSFEFNFDLLFHVYIIICRICVYKHTGCTLVSICMCAALSKYNWLVLFSYYSMRRKTFTRNIQ